MVTTSQQQVKLLDFGLAKLLRISETATTETVGRLCTFGGTAPYMSPEQLLGKVPDFRSDIYSLGAVLYEMATGRRPFEEKVPTALTEEVLHRPPSPPTLVNPSISPRFQDVILKCLEKDSDDRYQSVKELIVDLRRLATPSGVPIEITGPTHATHRQKQNKVMFGTIVILALLASIGFASRYLRARPRRHQVVLVGDFSNRTDDSVFDEVIPELLSINLEQSGFISRVSIEPQIGDFEADETAPPTVAG
jgi:serine/threonine protein kinase